MNDTEDPLLALTNTFLRRYSSSSSGKTSKIIEKKARYHL